MQIGFVKAALVLGLLCLIGPFSIDLYLPALPAIGQELGASDAAVQMTLMAYFLAFGLMQIIYGPVSDAYGRRPPMLVGLAIFAAASLGCYLAPSIGWLIAFRALQGIGASAVMVIPRAVIRDLHTGPEATRLMALVMLVISVSPMLAPLIGSFLIVPFGWRSVFAAVLGASVLSALLVRFVLPETHPAERRAPVSLRRMGDNFGRLLRDRAFMGLTLIGGFGMGSFFAFLASASFLYIERYGLSPTQFALAFAFNAVGFFAMSQGAGVLTARFGMGPVIKWAVTGFAAGGCLLAVVTFTGLLTFPILAGLLFVTYAFLGLVIPTAMVLALETNGPIAGAASALGGTVQMITGALTMGLVSVLPGATAHAMSAIIAGCGVGAFILSRATLTGARTAQAASS